MWTQPGWVALLNALAASPGEDGRPAQAAWLTGEGEPRPLALRPRGPRALALSPVSPAPAPRGRLSSPGAPETQEGHVLALDRHRHHKAGLWLSKRAWMQRGPSVPSWHPLQEGPRGPAAAWLGWGFFLSWTGVCSQHAVCGKRRSVETGVHSPWSGSRRPEAAETKVPTAAQLPALVPGETTPASWGPSCAPWPPGGLHPLL